MKVSYSELEDAFLVASYERRYWLDKRTGRIRSYSNEAAQALEEDDLDDLPEWMEADLADARDVLRAFGELPTEDENSQVANSPSSVDGSVLGFEPGATEDDRVDAAVDPSRYVSIEQIPSHDAFQFMADFADEMNASRAREALGRALSGNKPFRRFKDALLDYPKEREQWFEYEARRRREYIEEWARDQGVELDFSGQGDEIR